MRGRESEREGEGRGGRGKKGERGGGLSGRIQPGLTKMVWPNRLGLQRRGREHPAVQFLLSMPFVIRLLIS